jgi:hypothetical protein
MVAALRKKWTDEGWDLNPTEHGCAACGDPISFTEEVFLLKVVQAQLIDGCSIEYHDVFNDTGSFAYEPYFFEFMCWETIEEELNEHFEDFPPIADPGGLLECATCASDIPPWEIFGLITFGELHCAKRTPNGSPTTIFADMQGYKHICISCLHLLNEVNSFWTNPLQPIPGLDTCEEGIYSRCWRSGNCPCEATIQMVNT